MSERHETVREVCAEMNYCKAESYSTGGCNDCRGFDCRDVRMFVGRILAAYEHEMAAKDAEIERMTVDLNAHLDTMQLRIDEMVEIVAARDVEIARLKAALKPVMDVVWRKVWGSGGCYTEIASTPTDIAVSEAQRIMKEGEAK